MRPLGFVLILLLSTVVSLIADDHLVYQRTAQFQGQTMPPKQLEIWLSHDRAFVNDGRVVTIYRLDLRKVWKLEPGGKKFAEFELSDTLLASQNPPPTLHYDWSVQRGKKDTVMFDLALHHHRLLGDAETSEINADVWFPDRPSGEVARYCNGHFKPFFFLDILGWKIMTDSIALFQSRIIVEARWSGTTGVAQGIDGFKLVKYESATAPPGLYELPEGAERVDSL